ncbi:hypothetical protein [Nocardia brasiliensis]|uniref:hypothetical protein n=1 Tax=Nocardia brasiliensis TaxID=37326 RepID=UPI0024552A0B|nr:hypothetical protein [Nocardia brasiliensis]
MTTDPIAEIAKSGTKAQLAAQIAYLQTVLADLTEFEAHTATVESVEPDGPHTRITLVVHETYGTVWADFRIGDAVSIADSDDLPTAILTARNANI